VQTTGIVKKGNGLKPDCMPHGSAIAFMFIIPYQIILDNSEIKEIWEIKEIMGKREIGEPFESGEMYGGASLKRNNERRGYSWKNIE
jgi:hypothetical protein